MSAGIVWLNGRFLSAERARIPATHPLVLQGLGVFETLRIVRGQAPLVALHQARLVRSCAALGIPTPVRDWSTTIAKLAIRNRIRSGRARITVGSDVALVTCARLPAGLARERCDGVALSTLRQPRAAADLKTTSWLPIWWAEHAAGGEVLLRGARGELLESTRANFFVVNAAGITTAAPPDVLPGIARELVLELASDLGVRVSSRPPTLRTRARWREAFLTNAVRGVRPVRSLDGIPLPAAGPDSLTLALQKALDQRMGL